MSWIDRVVRTREGRSRGVAHGELARRSLLDDRLDLRRLEALLEQHAARGSCDRVVVDARDRTQVADRPHHRDAQVARTDTGGEHAAQLVDVHLAHDGGDRRGTARLRQQALCHELGPDLLGELQRPPRQASACVRRASSPVSVEARCASFTNESVMRSKPLAPPASSDSDEVVAHGSRVAHEPRDGDLLAGRRLGGPWRRARRPPRR